MRKLSYFNQNSEDDASRNQNDYMSGSNLGEESDFTQQKGQYYKIRPFHPTAFGCKLDCIFHFLATLTSAFSLFYFEHWQYLIISLIFLGFAIAAFFMQKRMSRVSLAKTEKVVTYLMIYHYARTLLGLIYFVIGGWLVVCVVDHTWDTNMVPPTGILSIVSPKDVGYHGWWLGLGLVFEGATILLYWNSFRKEIKAMQKINQQKIFFQD
jgi:hypothetical protein